MMYDQARNHPAFNLFVAGAAILASGAIAALAITQLAGTKTGIALALIAIGGPVMIYAAIVAPLIFPFLLYVFAIPFDNILDLTSFGTLTKLLAIASGAAIVFFQIRTRRIVRPPRSLLLWAALYVWAAMSAFWAIDQRSVFVALATSLELLTLYAAISMLPADRNALRWISFATIAGGVIAAVYGSILFHNGVDLYYGGRLRITTDTGAIDPNHFGAALLLPISLCFTGLLSARKMWPVLVNLAALGALFVGLTLSESRGAILAVIVMLAYFFIRSAARLRLLAFCVAGAVIGLAFGSQTALWGRFGVAISTGGAGRTSIWRVGFSWLLSALSRRRFS